MKKERIYRFNWSSLVLILALVVTGCASKTTEPATTLSSIATSIPPTAVTAETNSATSIPTTTPPTVEVTEAITNPVNVVDSNVLYHDDFTNPASGWPENKFDNYFVGYHEPEFYHVEVSSPQYKTTVFEPEKKSFGDVTIEVKAFTASSKTSETGDFSFGPAFRRSGDQYYAFTISPRSKKWFVLKSTPNALSILAEGTDENIHDADATDVLRVDAQGSNFSFSINDQLVSQVTDADYATGEVGFFVQTIDAAHAHIHFDELTIRNFEPSLVCKIKAEFLHVRSGPGTDYSAITFVSDGDTIEPIGRNKDGDWLLIALDRNGNQMWLSNTTSFVSCNAAFDILPIIPAH